MSRRQPPTICIPAPARKKRRKNIAFQYRFGTAVQQRPPPLGDDKRFEFRPDPRSLNCRCIRLAEQEPKESIGPKSHKIGTLADRRKVRSAEQFERHTTTPGRSEERRVGKEGEDKACAQ